MTLFGYFAPFLRETIITTSFWSLLWWFYQLFANELPLSFIMPIIKMPFKCDLSLRFIFFSVFLIMLRTALLKGITHATQAGNKTDIFHLLFISYSLIVFLGEQWIPERTSQSFFQKSRFLCFIIYFRLSSPYVTQLCSLPFKFKSMWVILVLKLSLVKWDAKWSRKNEPSLFLWSYLGYWSAYSYSSFRIYAK